MKSEKNAEKSARRKIEIHLGPNGEKALKMYKKEIVTYVRELPRLLKKGQDGWYALIKGDDIVGTWPTYGEASGAGIDKFGLASICVVKIEARNVERYAALMEQIKERKCPS